MTKNKAIALTLWRQAIHELESAIKKRDIMRESDIWGDARDYAEEGVRDAYADERAMWQNYKEGGEI